jgi:endonuclease/exonuclease/phosphatase (EEP) superfamily protein YafD
MILTIVLYLMCLVCVVATLLPLSRHEAWWIRACDFPRLQIVTASAAILVALLAASALHDTAGRLLVLALLGCIAYQLAVILPYTRLWRVEIPACGAPAGNRTLVLLVVNVLMSNRRADGLLALIRAHQPDVVLARRIAGGARSSSSCGTIPSGRRIRSPTPMACSCSPSSNSSRRS